MPMPKPRVRPRLTRLSTSSSSSFRKLNPQIYTFLVAGLILLFISVSVLQMRLGRASTFRAHGGPRKIVAPENDHLEEGAIGSHFFPANQEKDEPGTEVRKQEGAEIGRDGRIERPERVNQSKVSKGEQKLPTKGEPENGDESEKEGEGEEGREGLEGEVVQFAADFEGKETDMNDDEMDDFEFGDVGEKLNEVRGFAKVGREFQGQVLDDMDKFVKGQVMEDTTKLGAAGDEEPPGKSGDSLGQAAYRKDQKASEDIANEHAKEESIARENISRLRGEEGRKWGKKEPWELTRRKENVNRERVNEGQEKFDKLDQWHSEDRVQSAKESKGLSQALEKSGLDNQQQEAERKKGAFFWDHALGVRKRYLKNDKNPIKSGPMNSNPIPTITETRRDREQKGWEKVGAKVTMHQLREFKDFVQSMKERYNSDDEPLDEDVQRQLEEVIEIEDALMLERESSSSSKTPPQQHQNKSPAGVFDPVNPANNPMLQDPDTLPGSWMTKSDKAILRAMRADEYDRLSLLTNRHFRGGGGQNFSQGESAQIMLPTDDTAKYGSLLTHVREDKDRDGNEELHSEDLPPFLAEKTAEISKDERLGSIGDTKSDVELFKDQEQAKETKSDVQQSEEAESSDRTESAAEDNEEDDHDDLIQWGFYPTMSRRLKFSKFVSAFFKQGRCSQRIFMAWTTAPWAYTPRHQRAMESLLHFHPQACIVVFTETIDFEFFDTFVNEGYKIAVVRPNLEELLRHTPAIEFAYVWPEWRNTKLFYIHYTELLRIAALYKYGGVWLDMDMILEKPLPKVHNTVGSTVLEDGEVVLNGAFMAFNKSSRFLKACIEEFTATYDEKLLGWNGAGVLNRIATNATETGGKRWLDEPDHLHVQDPFAFFPISLHNITRYFFAPTDHHEELEDRDLLTRISNESYATHLWNSLTVRLVPETGSLVERILNKNCMRCTDLL